MPDTEPIRVGDRIEVPNHPSGVTLDSGIVTSVDGEQVTFRVIEEYDAMERDWDYAYIGVEPFERTVGVSEVHHHWPGWTAEFGDRTAREGASDATITDEGGATPRQPNLAEHDARAMPALAPTHEIILEIGLVIEDQTEVLADWVTEHYADDSEPWEGSELVYNWELGSLRHASDYVLAEVQAHVAMAREDYPEGYATEVEIDLLLVFEDGAWRVTLFEPRPHEPAADRFAAAFGCACAHHADHRRKGTHIPSIAHPLAVSALVLEMQPDSEDEAIAALLHDVLEDGGGMDAAGEILRRFGLDVLRIVLASSDTRVTPKPPWAERKQRYIAAIAHKAPDELRVSLADKLHNARAILFDYRAHQEALVGALQRQRRADALVLPRARRGLPTTCRGPRPRRRSRSRGTRPHRGPDRGGGHRCDERRAIGGLTPL